MMPIRRLCLLLMFTTVAALRADTTQLVGDWDSVTIAPAKTSIYVGSISLSTSEFRRNGDHFTATYEVKVRPWFFWSETGNITIQFPAANLEKLVRGERAEFTGDAMNHRNKPRHVTGYAERTGDATGKIKVRISVDDIELIFNTTYRFNNVVK